MADSKGLIDDAADGLKSLLGRLGEFFHIFDLSFFVAGAVSFGAISFLFIKLGLVGAFSFAPWVAGLAIVIACYVCGLVCFSLGRPLNRVLFRRRVLDNLLHRSIKVHQLTFPRMSSYLESGNEELWRLYIRLWQQLAAKHARSVSFSHLSRYWAMAAIYDSLAVALLFWAAVIASLALLERHLPLAYSQSPPSDFLSAPPSQHSTRAASITNFRSRIWLRP
jgi:hypothetical protein